MKMRNLDTLWSRLCVGFAAPAFAGAFTFPIARGL